MTTWYINVDTGDDGTGDGSSGNPWETLAHAYDNSIADDTIECQTSTATYAFVTDTLTGRTIQGEGTPIYNPLTSSWIGAVFDGGGGDAYWGSSGNAYKDLVIQNVNTPAAWEGGLLSSGNTLRLERVVFIDCLTPHLKAGITGIGSSIDTEVTLIGVVAYSTTGQINMDLFGFSTILADAGDLYIYNCVMFNGGAVMSGNRYQDGTVVIKNSIFRRDTSGADMRVGIFTGTTFDFDNNCTYNYTDVPAGDDNITDDPLFVDENNGDFRLRPTSPCIDTGVLL